MKMRTKTVVTALSISMLLGTVPYAVYADTPTAHTAATSAVTQEQAIAIAKKQFTISDEYKLQNASFRSVDQSPLQDANVWMLNFRTETNGPGGDYLFVNINADTGAVISFDQSKATDTSLENSISRDDAQKIAANVLKQYAPDHLANLKQIDTPSQTYNGPSGVSTYLFRYVRVVNGIPYPADGVSIRLNGRGELRGFSLQWNDSLQFPTSAATPSVTADQAKDTFQKALKLQLQYQRQYTPNGSTNLNLVYAPWGYYGGASLPMIDADKGVAIGADGNMLGDTTPSFTPLSDQPSAPVPTQEITKEAALAMVPGYHLDLNGYTLQSADYQQNSNGSTIVHQWQLQYTKGASGTNQAILSIAIDAKTGDLLHINNFNMGSSSSGSLPANPAVPKEQAKQNAIEFMKHAMPSQADRLSFDPATDVIRYVNSGDYHFRFVPLIDGLPVNGFMYDVSIDPNTGNVQEFNADSPNVDNLQFPKKQDAIPADAALASYVKANPLQLIYTPIYTKSGSPYQNDNKIKGVALVYAPFNVTPPQVLNAVTGEWFSLYGAGSQTTNISDIKGHWAEKQLQYFADSGIFEVKDGKLDPNATLTRGDVMKLLILAINGPRNAHDNAHFADVPNTDPNYEFIEEAVSRKWIDSSTKNFRPNAVMTREELTDAVVRILGYQKLASSPDAFKPHYADVKTSDPYFADISIVSTIGIMGGYEKSFAPNGQITKAQFAVVLAKLTEQLREKQQGYPYYGV